MTTFRIVYEAEQTVTILADGLKRDEAVDRADEWAAGRLNGNRFTLKALHQWLYLSPTGQKQAIKIEKETA
jgi:hypothetical protein